LLSPPIKSVSVRAGDRLSIILHNRYKKSIIE